MVRVKGVTGSSVRTKTRTTITNNAAPHATARLMPPAHDSR